MHLPFHRAVTRQEGQKKKKIMHMISAGSCYRDAQIVTCGGFGSASVLPQSRSHKPSLSRSDEGRSTDAASESQPESWNVDKWLGAGGVMGKRCSKK